MRLRTILLPTLVLYTVALPVTASDGRIEINQAKVLAGGVTPGDGPGFPASIDAPGSFILTSDLDLSAAPSPENTNAIVISTEGVTLDLNGFSIRGTTVCTGGGSTISCAPLGSGHGIISFGARTVVKNGGVRGTGASCISFNQPRNVAEDLVLSWCGGDGLDAEGEVRRVRADLNYGAGIRSQEGPITSCTAIANRFEGIVAEANAVVSGSVTEANGAAGIFAQSSAVVDSVANNNEGFELSLNFASWAGNTLLNCGAFPCESGAGSLQTGVNNCDGSPCP